MSAIQTQSAAVLAKQLSAQVKEVKGIKLISHNMGEGSMEAMRTLCDRVRENLPSGIIALGTTDQAQDKVFLLVTVSSDLTKTYNAGKFIQAIAPLIDGKGGGKPEQAQAGGMNKNGLSAALQKVAELIS